MSAGLRLTVASLAPQSFAGLQPCPALPAFPALEPRGLLVSCPCGLYATGPHLRVTPAVSQLMLFRGIFSFCSRGCLLDLLDNVESIDQWSF